MTQKILATLLGGLTVSGTGIVTVLVVLGLILKMTNADASIGAIAIGGGILIGLALGALGIVGVLITLVKRLS
jgi:hypothetical protein